MEDQHWNVPIWSNRKFNEKEMIREHTYTYPDWGNVGPTVFSGKTTDDLTFTNESEGTWLKDGAPLTAKKRKYNYQRQKDIERKFPLEKTLQFAYPLLHPRKIHSFRNVNDAKRVFRGNCLDVLEMNGRIYVLHPMGQRRVFASMLKKGIYCKEDETQEDNLFFKLNECANFPLNEPLYQIVAKEVNNTGIVLFRSRTEAQLLALQEEEEVVKSNRCDVLNNYLTTDIALSDTLPGVWALACANGEVLLQNAQDENCLWHASFQKKRVKSRLSRYHCDFGKHPLSLIVGNESTIWVCDTRMKARVNIHSEPETSGIVHTVVKVNEMKKYYSDFEEICSFTHIKRLPYLYVVSANSVYVMDERYCKMPVMSWKHLLMKRPSYISTQEFGDKQFLMLANSHEKKVSVIANQWEANNYNVWCRGLSLPKHFHIAKDTINFAHKQDLWFRHQVHDWLESTWSGIASFVHPNDNLSMLFLSLYSNCDIFAQLFKVSKGHDKGLPQNTGVRDTQCGKEILSRWEEDIVKVSIKKSLSNSFTYFDASSFYQKFVCNGISEDLKEMFAGLPVPIIDDSHDKDDAPGSRLCHSKADNDKKKDTWQVRELVRRLKKKRQNKSVGNTSQKKDKDPLWVDSLLDNYICDYDVYDMKDLSLPGNSGDSDILSNYLPRKMASFLKMDNLKKCKDFLAPKILSLWQMDEAESSTSTGPCNFSHEPTFHYYTAPFDVTCLSSLPPKLEMETHHDTMEATDTNLEVVSQTSQVSQSISMISKDASQLSESTPLLKRKSRKICKKKLKKRVDGF
ncbi:uncharacterized protein [Panulirus ornatus]|uniref:uncharacterized protein n=1 Tax=Panulirus ornatus TaxID=150431 RepID=UPI003A8666D4